MECEETEVSFSDKAPAVKIGGRMCAPLSLPHIANITPAMRTLVESLVFEREDCFFTTLHSELCKAWGLVVTTAQETKVPHQVNESCDPWPVFDENLQIDFGLEGTSLKNAIFNSADDKNNMIAMLDCKVMLKKAVLCLYRKVEARSGISLEDERIKLCSRPERTGI